MATVLERMAAVVQAVKPGDLPPEVLHETRRRLLDGLGNMVGGSTAPTVRSVYAAVGTGGPASLAGDARRATPADAALANCTALRYLDYMDGHPGPYPCQPRAAGVAAATSGWPSRRRCRCCSTSTPSSSRTRWPSPPCTARPWTPAAVGRWRRASPVWTAWSPSPP
jgi:MmgE/PrpD N-terminal domain